MFCVVRKMTYLCTHEVYGYDSPADPTLWHERRHGPSACCCSTKRSDYHSRRSICGRVEELSEAQHHQLEQMTQRLEQGEPVQYVLGRADFGGRAFHVEPGVLIPRAETYELCQWIIEDHNRPYCALQPPAPLHVLDIGTGSGCIAVTLALDLWNSSVTAWDISPDALLIARGNAHRLGATVNFELHDILDASCQQQTQGQPVDLIVSNPPYVCEGEKAGMAKNVLDHEPALALFVPDDDPLRFYRAIARHAAEALQPRGELYLEINPLYAEELSALLSTSGFQHIEVHEDQFGRQRMMKAQKD
jgi:release factor glutamine methyltransferase